MKCTNIFQNIFQARNLLEQKTCPLLPHGAVIIFLLIHHITGLKDHRKDLLKKVMLIIPFLLTTRCLLIGVQRMRRHGRSLRNMIIYQAYLFGVVLIISVNLHLIPGLHAVHILASWILPVFPKTSTTCIKVSGLQNRCCISFLIGTGSLDNW